MRCMADRAGVWIVTGDTKVVERGVADKLFVNIAGVGGVPSEHAGMVVMQTAFGGERIVDMLAGEQLPRIS